jgi:hypothetical protein
MTAYGKAQELHERHCARYGVTPTTIDKLMSSGRQYFTNRAFDAIRKERGSPRNMSQRRDATVTKPCG